VERATFGRPALAVVAGLTYRERSQVFNRWLVPVYQMSIRWTGNRPDAEDATTWVLINGMRRLNLPELVQVVDEQLAELTIEAVARHWSERYGVSPLRCSSIHATEAALMGRPALSLDALTDRLTAEQRLVIVLRFLRRRSPSSIATQLGIAAEACANLLFRALSDVAERLGLDADATDLAQVDRVAAFVGDLVARRKPLRFEATPAAWAALLAATHLQAAIAGNDLPRVRFVRSVEDIAAGNGSSPYVTPSRIWIA
jgi:sigma-70-like protein